MIKDYQNKEVLAEMKRQVNAAAKISDREARITFVLIHMISEYHILAEQCNKPDGENNLFRFVLWCLSRFCDELELPADGEFTNPIERSGAHSRRNAETGQAYRPRGWHKTCVSRERITKKVRYLSILTFLSGLLDSNQRPRAPQTCALPTALNPDPMNA